MEKFKCRGLILSICLLVMGVSNVSAGEPAFEYEIKGKTISAIMTVILLDALDPDGTVYIAVGTCKKVPFQLGPIYGDVTEFAGLEEDDFFDINGNPQYFLEGVQICSDPDALPWGYAITGFKNWVKTANAVITDVFLEPVYPVDR